MNGEIDRREYIDEPGEIYDIDRDGYVRTNIHSDGKGEFYDYRGKIYCIHFPDEKDDDYSEWWVSPYNISVEKKDIGKIKWYHKGKLEESVHCAADLIGKRVTFVGDQSLVLDYGDEGTVQDIVSINLVKVHWDKYISKSINGHSWNVNTNYLDLCETEEMGEIKWYYKGKLNK